MGGLIGIANMIKAFRYVEKIKLSQGESFKLKVNGLLVLTNLVTNYSPAFYIINYGGPSYEHIAGRTFENINLTAEFDEDRNIVFTSTSVNGANIFYSYQSISI